MGTYTGSDKRLKYLFEHGGGGGGMLPHLIIYATTGSTVNISKNGTTITATETSSGVFEADVSSYGTYIITALLNGQTKTTSITVDAVKIYEVSMTTTVTVSFVIYSAKEDTVTFIDASGVTKTEVFASNQSSKNIMVEISPNGSSITFVSTIAKDPNNLASNYSKTILITENTTSVYVMPNNGSGVLYWFGYESSDLQDLSNANGWVTDLSGFYFSNPTHNTNYIDCYATGSNSVVGVGSNNKISGAFYAICQGIIGQGGTYAGLMSANNKSWYNFASQIILTSSNLSKLSLGTQTDKYIDYVSNYSGGTRRSQLFALFVE